MNITINIRVKISDDQVEAFEMLEGPATERTISDYILANGVTGLEDLVEEYRDLFGEAA